MAELQSTMTHKEFLSWQYFYEEAPFDDHYRYHRPAVLVAQSMSGGDAQEKLDFLVPKQTENIEGFSDADLKTLAAFGIKPPAQ